MGYFAKDLTTSGLFGTVMDALAGNWLTGVTAGTTQTQAGATALTAANNVIGTCANAGDGVILPVAGKGSKVYVRNGGVAAANVYPPVGGAINGGTANAAVSLAAGATATFTFTSDLNCNY